MLLGHGGMEKEAGDRGLQVDKDAYIPPLTEHLGRWGLSSPVIHHSPVKLLTG